MRFFARVASPAIEGVIERDARCKLLEIVKVHARKPERCSEQARGFGRKLEARGVGASDDQSYAVERGASKAEFVEHRVECAELTPMAPENALDIEGRAVEALRDRLHLRGRNEQEHGFRIDEATDQPGTGDTIDFRS